MPGVTVCWRVSIMSMSNTMKVFKSMSSLVSSLVDKQKQLEAIVGGTATSEVMGQRCVELRARLHDTIQE